MKKRRRKIRSIDAKKRKRKERIKVKRKNRSRMGNRRLVRICDRGSRN
jgi:hypothetical protein